MPLCFWLFNFFNPASTFDQIRLNDFAAFQTVPDAAWGPYFNTLALYGFWSNDYFLPKDIFGCWWILTFIILILFAIGVYQVFKNKHILGITLSLLFIPILLIAVGYGHWFTQPIVKFLYFSLPGFKGLRETGKLIGLLAFSYAQLVPIGARTLINLSIRCCRDEASFEGDNDHCRLQPAPRLYTSHRIYSCIFTVFIFATCLSIPILSVQNIFWGFSGQLHTSDYPAGWYEANQLLTGGGQTFGRLPVEKVLFLPWHGYPRLSFANFKRISNPAPKFFAPEIITGQNIDNVYILETKQELWDEKIFQLVHGLETLDQNMEFLKSQNISHIILAKEMDFERYAFLQDSKYLDRVMDTGEIIIYKLK